MAEQISFYRLKYHILFQLCRTIESSICFWLSEDKGRFSWIV